MLIEVTVLGTQEMDECGEVPMSYLPELSRRAATGGFPQSLGNSLEEDVYSNLLLTFLFVKPQFFSSIVSIKHVLTFLRS